MNEGGAAATGGGGGKKRLSVERIYQRKTQLEHILLRPDTYVGSVEECTQLMWVWDEEREAIVQRQINFVPGLYKIFDEILGECRRGECTANIRCHYVPSGVDIHL